MHRSIRSFNIPSPLSLSNSTGKPFASKLTSEETAIRFTPLSLSNSTGKPFASKLTSEETAIRFTSDIYISNFIVNI